VLDLQPESTQQTQTVLIRACINTGGNVKWVEVWRVVVMSTPVLAAAEKLALGSGGDGPEGGQWQRKVGRGVVGAVAAVVCLQF